METQIRLYILVAKALILLLVLTGYQKTSAQTLDDYLQKLPEYLVQASINAEQIQQAKICLENFAPFLIRGHSMMSRQNGEVEADQRLEQISIWIVQNSHLSPDKVFLHIGEQFCTEKEPVLVPGSTLVSSFTPVDTDDYQALKLLKSLARFSVNSVTGTPRMVLQGSKGLEANLYRFYGQAKGVNPQDWDFLLLWQDLPGLLDVLSLPPELAQKMASPHHKSGQSLEIIYLEGYAMTLLLHENQGRQGPVLTVKLLKQDTDKLVYRYILSLDCFFAESLPQTTYILFESVGYLPVMEALPTFQFLQTALANQPDFSLKHKSRLLIWQELERQHHRLNDNPELQSQLMTDDLGLLPPPKLPLDNGTKNNTEWIKFKVALPDFTYHANYLMRRYEEQNLKQQLRHRLKTSSRQRGKQEKEFYREKWKLLDELEIRKTVTNWYADLELNSLSPRRQEENYKKIISRLKELWRFQKEAEDSAFLTYFSYFCEKNCNKCKCIKVSFHYYLLLEQLDAGEALDTMLQAVQSISAGSKSPYLLNFAAQIQTLSLELLINAAGQKNTLKNYMTSLCINAREKICNMPSPLNHLADLYKFLYYNFNFLDISATVRGHSPAIQFRELVRQWQEHLLVINRLAFQLVDPEAVPVCQISQLHIPELQLLVFGAVLNDIHALSESFPSTVALANQCPDILPEGDSPSLDKKSFNTVLRRVLLSPSWLNVYDEDNPLSKEKASELLTALESLSLSDNSHSETSGAIRDYWREIEKQNERQRAKARAIAIKNAEELIRKETELIKMREKLMANHKPLKPPTPEVPEKTGPQKNAGISQSKLPPATWEKKLATARSKAGNKHYKKAKGFYKKALQDAPKSMHPIVLVEHADICMRAVTEDIAALVKLQEAIHHIHIMFENKLHSLLSPRTYGSLVSRDCLIETAQLFVEEWIKIEPRLQEVIKDQEHALTCLNSLPDQTDTCVAFNSDFLKMNVDYLFELHQQTLQSRSLLLETFSFRKQWLNNVAKSADQSTRKSEIPSLLKQLKNHEKTHRELLASSTALLKNMGRTYQERETNQPYKVSSSPSCSYPGARIEVQTRKVPTINNEGAGETTALQKNSASCKKQTSREVSVKLVQPQLQAFDREKLSLENLHISRELGGQAISKPH